MSETFEVRKHASNGCYNKDCQNLNEKPESFAFADGFFSGNVDYCSQCRTQAYEKYACHTWKCTCSDFNKKKCSECQKAGIFLESQEYQQHFRDYLERETKPTPKIYNHH